MANRHVDDGDDSIQARLALVGEALAAAVAEIQAVVTQLEKPKKREDDGR
jgi:hypothetical protein